MEINDRTISVMEEWMAKSRQGRYGLMALAFAAYNPETKGASWTWQSDCEACTGRMGDMINYWKAKDTIAIVAFNGGTPKNCGSGGTYGLPNNSKFEGTELSLAWLEFILSDEAPWMKKSNLKEFFANDITDLKKINYETGFIFKNVVEAPAEALFSFIMATRYAQENERRCVVWKSLVDEGVDPRIAFIYSHSFGHNGGNTGPVQHSICMSPTKQWARQFFHGPVLECVPIMEKGLRGVAGADAWFINPKDTDIPKSFTQQFFPTGIHSKEDRIQQIKDFVGV